jgi:hypothetical protein
VVEGGGTVFVAVEVPTLVVVGGFVVVVVGVTLTVEVGLVVGGLAVVAAGDALVPIVVRGIVTVGALVVWRVIAVGRYAVHEVTRMSKAAMETSSKRGRYKAPLDLIKKF